MKKFHKIGTSLLATLSPALALGTTLGIIVGLQMNKKDPVTPSVAVEGVTLPESTTIVTDESGEISLAANITPANATNKNLTWKSSDPDIISVDENTGILTVVSKASNAYVTITCTTVDGGFSASCKVYVKEPTDQSIFSCRLQKSIVGGTPTAFITGFKDGVTIPEDIVFPSKYTDDNGYTYVVKALRWQKIPKATITSVVVPSSYTSVSFVGWTTLKYCYFSDAEQSSLTYLSQGSFANCTALTSVRLSSSIYAIGMDCFSGCTALTTIDFKDAVNLQYIEARAFLGCTSLKDIELPDTLIDVSSTAFPYLPPSTLPYSKLFNVEEVADGLNMVYLKKDLNGTNDHFVALGLLMPNPGTYNVNLKFNETTKLIAMNFIQGFLDQDPTETTTININSIEFNNKLIAIGEEAFLVSKPGKFYSIVFNVKDLVFPESLLYIEANAFRALTTYLTSVTFNEGLEYIGDGAFAYQHNLKKLAFPATLKQIGSASPKVEYGAFQQCYSVDEITFAANSKLEVIGGYAFYRLSYDGSTPFITKQIEVKLPDSVKEIWDMAFYSSFIPKDYKFTIPSKCEYLGTECLAFYNQELDEAVSNPKYIEVTIPSSVQEMCCPFGYLDDEFRGPDYWCYPIVSKDTLTFVDKDQCVWTVEYDYTPTFSEDVYLDSTGHLSQNDFDKYMGGEPWEIEAGSENYVYPDEIYWTKQ